MGGKFTLTQSLNKHDVKEQITKLLTRRPGNTRAAETKFGGDERSKTDVSKAKIISSNLAAIQSMIDLEDSSDEDVDDPMEMDENIVAAIQFD